MSGAAKRLAAVIFAVAIALLATGCGAREEITLGYLEWDENVANSNLIKVILEDELGYEQVHLKLDGVKSVFPGLAAGEVDAFTDAWMPNHRKYVDEVEEEVELSAEPWYVGETEYGIAVPDYMGGVRSIADLDSSGATMITGIEWDAVLMEKIDERVIPRYDLEIALVEASTPAMLEELDRAYRAKEPIVFLGWSPHWMNEQYDFHYLDDPKDAMGTFDEPNRLHSVFRAGLSEEDPTAYALINAMKLTEEQVGTLELAIKRAESPEQGARRWLEDHRNVVEPWIEAAKQAGE